MNYNYMKVKDKVLVVEDNEIISIRDNHGDIKNVLSLENRFDELNGEILDFQDRYDYYLDSYRERKMLSLSIPSIGVILPIMANNISVLSANSNALFTICCLLAGAIYFKGASNSVKNSEKAKFFIERLGLEMGNVLKEIVKRGNYDFTNLEDDDLEFRKVPDYIPVSNTIDNSYNSAKMFANSKKRLYELYNAGVLDNYLKENGCSSEDILIFNELLGKESLSDSSEKKLIK